MRIRMLQGMAGHDFSWAAGEEVEVSDALGTSLADGVRAVRVIAPKPAAPAKPAPKRGGQPVKTATAGERETR